MVYNHCCVSWCWVKLSVLYKRLAKVNSIKTWNNQSVLVSHSTGAERGGNRAGVALQTLLRRQRNSWRVINNKWATLNVIPFLRLSCANLALNWFKFLNRKTSLSMHFRVNASLVKDAAPIFVSLSLHDKSAKLGTILIDLLHNLSILFIWFI